MATRWCAVIAVALVGGCSIPDAMFTNVIGDAATDAPTAALTVVAMPSVFDLHAGETRDTRITVTNTGGNNTGTSQLQVTGLTVGTTTVTTNTCTGTLAPGATCTASAHLVGTTPGQSTFLVTVDAEPGGIAIASLSATVRPACAATCGPTGTTDCCASAIVPGNAVGATAAGELFYRGYDVGADGAFPSKMFPATVSDFRLDLYEVTVGRFRVFVNAGMGLTGTAPPAGTGAHAAITNSGWDATWTGHLETATTTLEAFLQCQPSYQIQPWSNTAGSNESLPIACLDWYEAMAFCIWDGGYLPTQAEWNYAAAGGSQQRVYPWSSPATATTADCTDANYNPGTTCVLPPNGGPNRVGSESPKGDGRWGQTDLAGNSEEWILDGFGSAYPMPCDDCANLAVTNVRGAYGGSFYGDSTAIRPADHDDYDPILRLGVVGVRCARAP